MIKNGKDINCLFCNKTFYVSRYRIKSAKYCSYSCKSKANPIDQSKIKRKYGENHWRWSKNGTRRKDGYILIRINGRRYFQHRYVVEQSLGRKLTYDETIHHINKNRSDNRIENLEILSRSEHSKKFPAFRGGTVKKNCRQCGTEFTHYKHDVVRRFCSKKCWYSSRK